MLKRIKSFGVFVALSLAFLSSARAQFSSPSVAIISSAGIDAFAGTGIGSVLTRTTTGWKTLNCLSGQVMLFQGVGTNSICYTPTGTGTVTSVNATVPSFMSVSGGPITASGTLAFSFNSATANTFLAAPDGSAGVPSQRTIVSGDLPATIAVSNITSATTLALNAGPGSPVTFGTNGSTIVWSFDTGANLIPGTDIVRNIGNATKRPLTIYGQNLGAVATPFSSFYLTTAAGTIFGNPSSASANGSLFTIQGLVDVSAPSATLDWIPIYNAASGTIKKVNASELQTAVGGGVSSFNSRTGAVVPVSGDYSSDKIATVSSGTPPGAGAIGELKTATVNIGSAIVAAPVTSTNIASLSLTAGSWVCSANPALYVQTGDTINSFVASIGTITATLTTSPAGGYVQSFYGAPVGNSVQMSSTNAFFDLASTTTVYLVGWYSLGAGATNSQFWGALNCYRRA